MKIYAKVLIIDKVFMKKRNYSWVFGIYKLKIMACYAIKNWLETP